MEKGIYETHDQDIMDVLEDDKNKIMRDKTYETDRDYILDVLFKAEDQLVDNINHHLSEPIQFELAKLLAVRNAIEDINVKHAYEKGHVEQEKSLNL